jgi:hypothetical protein
VKPLLLLASVLALAACGDSSNRLTPVHFKEAHGWYVEAPQCSEGVVRICESRASTGPWHDVHWGYNPRILATRPNGVAIWLSVSERREGATVKYQGPWPPRVKRAEIGGLEGVPPNKGVFQWVGRLSRWDAYVIAFFGRANPTSGQIARANAELRSAQLP